MKYVCGALAGVCVVVVGMLSASAALADQEVVTFAVGDYKQTNGAGYCCSTCGELANPSSDATAFLDGGAFSTLYDQVASYANTGVDGRDFTDATQYAWGDDDIDPSGIDYADVIFFSGHAGWSSVTDTSHLVMGDDNVGESCTPTLGDDDSGSRHMELGNGGTGEEADIMVLYACNNPQYEVWQLNGYNATSHSSGQFNMINGFHGDVWEVSGYQDDLEGYATDAKWNAIGDAWIDRMYDPRNAGADDNCPLTLAYGANQSETDDFYVNAGWNDFHDTGSRSGAPRLYYLCGCDPVDGGALPPC